MTADDLPPNGSDGPDEDVTDPALAGSLRVLLAAHVDESIATDAAWADIERAAALVHRGELSRLFRSLPALPALWVPV